MCGLVGIAGDLEFKDEATMKRLLLLDYFRGPDSTGFASIKIDGEARVSKISSHPLDLFEYPKFKTALSASTSKVFLGHNRAATRGGVSTFNAHPFHYDHIVGAHNGTLDYQSVNRLEDAIGEKYAVDSMSLFAAIAKLGIKDAIELCAEGRDSQTGAWSLTWYDQNEGTLNFLRNTHRPLWYAFSADFKKIFWASQWEMISNAVQMSNNPYTLYTEPKTGNRFWSTQENTHYKIDVTVLRLGGDKRPKMVARTIKGREPAPVVATAGHTPFPAGNTIHGTTTTSRLTGTGSQTNQDISPRNLIHLFGSHENPLAGYLPPEKFQDLVKYGCSWCQADIPYDAKGITIFERDDIILCAECSGHKNQAMTGSRIIVPGQVIDQYK